MTLWAEEEKEEEEEEEEEEEQAFFSWYWVDQHFRSLPFWGWFKSAVSSQEDMEACQWVWDQTTELPGAVGQSNQNDQAEYPRVRFWPLLTRLLAARPTHESKPDAGSRSWKMQTSGLLHSLNMLRSKDYTALQRLQS